MPEQLLGNQCQIPRRGFGLLAVRVQAVRIDKFRPLAAELFGALVHHRDKMRFAAAQMLRHGNRRVIRGCDRNRLEHVIQRHALAFLEINL